MATKQETIIAPYGGKLVNLVVTGKEREELIAKSSLYPSIQISQRALCDLEMMATGGFFAITSRLATPVASNLMKQSFISTKSP